MNLTPEISARVDTLFSHYDRAEGPGCTVAIIQQGEMVYQRGFGLANLEHSSPNTPQTVFDIASISKHFTATCILLLEQEGKLSLDDDVTTYLPELDYQHVTLRHLLHHTSGIPDYGDLMKLAGLPWHNNYPLTQIIELIRQQPLMFKPGTAHLYGDSGYVLLGEVVARVSGQSLNDFATQHIFKPLGMNSSQFYDNHSRVVKARAIGYKPITDGFRIDHHKFDLVGDGGLHTTVEDLFLWDQNFYDNKLAGGQALLERLLTVGKLNSGKALDYACGLVVQVYRGQKVVWHNGGSAGYCSQFFRLPEQQLSIIILTNRNDYDYSGAHTIIDLLLENTLEPQKPVAAKKAFTAPSSPFIADDLNTYVGRYANQHLQTTYTLEVAGQGLKLSFPYQQPGFTLVPLAKDTFQAEEGALTFTFKRNSQGHISGLTVKYGRLKAITFKREK